MPSLAMAMLARGLARAPALGVPAVLETAAHGTLRLTVSFGRQELNQERGGGKVGMLDASPTVLMEEAAAPGLASGDAIHVEGVLYLIRAPLSNGKARIRADLEDGQTSRATWSDAAGAARSGRLVLVGCTGPDGHLDLAVGAGAAGLTRDPAPAGIPAGTRFETDDDGAEFEVLAVGAWAPGWTRLALRRVA